LNASPFPGEAGGFSVFSLFKKADTQDRRQFGRVSVPNGKVKASVHSLRQRERLSVQVLELNTDGVRFVGDALHGTLMRGEVVEVSLASPDKPQVIVSGEVKWVTAKGREFEGGIHFDHVGDAERQRIRGMIASMT